MCSCKLPCLRAYQGENSWAGTIVTQYIASYVIIIIRPGNARALVFFGNFFTIKCMTEGRQLRKLRTFSQTRFEVWNWIVFVIIYFGHDIKTFQKARKVIGQNLNSRLKAKEWTSVVWNKFSPHLKPAASAIAMTITFFSQEILHLIRAI